MKPMWRCGPVLLVGAVFLADASFRHGGLVAQEAWLPRCRVVDATAGVAGPPDRVVEARVEALLWRFVRADRAPERLLLQPETLTAVTRESADLLSGPERQAATAAVLASVFRDPEGGWNTSQARLAAALYFAWQLPVSAARGVLRDPQAPAFARTMALAALDQHTRSPWFVADVMTVLCDLGAVAAGVTQAVGGAPVLAEVLDGSQYTLATTALQQVMEHPDAPTMLNEVLRWLGPANPLSRKIAEYRGLVGR